MWLVVGSVPMALLGPHLISWAAPPGELDRTLKLCIGFALLFAALTYALRLYLNLRRMRTGQHADRRRPDRPALPTLLVGALGGLLVGITSVGSGSVIMIALLMLYPGLSAVRLVGHRPGPGGPARAGRRASPTSRCTGWTGRSSSRWSSARCRAPSLGGPIAPRVPQSIVRRGIVVVLTMSGVALLDKAGWAPLGAGERRDAPEC